MSVSVKTGPQSFLLQPKLLCLAFLLSKYSSHDVNATNFQKKNLKFLDILLLLVPLEILAHFAVIDISQWLEKHFFCGPWTKFSTKNLWFRWL